MLKKSLIAIGLAALSASAFAGHGKMPHGELSVGYVESGVDQGVRLGASVDVHSNFAVDVDFRDYGSDFDAQLLEYGVSYMRDLNQDVQLVAGLHLVDLESDMGDDDGFVVSLAAETQVADGLTLTTGVERFEFDDLVDNTDFFLGVNFDVTEDLTVHLEHREALDETGVRVSWSF